MFITQFILGYQKKWNNNGILSIYSDFFQQFDRCFIGSSPDQELDSMFCGQISSVYGFSDALSPQQIHAISALGPGYKVRVFEIVSSWVVLPISSLMAVMKPKLKTKILIDVCAVELLLSIVIRDFESQILFTTFAKKNGRSILSNASGDIPCGLSKKTTSWN